MGGREVFRPDIPSTARMYDYYLGGKDNYAADRKAAERVIAMLPDGAVRTAAAQNRQFLTRAVRHLAGGHGVRQFLDIGSGLPTMSNVHEVAQSIAPESRVVYVDHDPMVITHGRALLHDNDRAAIICGDARQPAGILADPTLRSLLDFGQPIAVLLVAILHFLSDSDDPNGIVGALMNAVPVGSYLVMSHFTADAAKADAVARVYGKASSSLYPRTRDQVAGFFAGLDLIAPGEVVLMPQWRHDAGTGCADDAVSSLMWCGVARKSQPGPPTVLPPLRVAPYERLPGRRPARSAAARSASARSASARVPVPKLWPNVPNIARMYDYMLGGKDNYPADREASQRRFAATTEAAVRGTALQNRRFLGRAVRYLTRDAGIRQFLDIGTGLPTMDNVHEVAHAIAPDARVGYVDNDLVVVAHGRDMLNGLRNATIVCGDLRDPAGILADPALRALLDFSRPIAVLLVAVLQFIEDDEDPYGIVRALMDAVPAGSYLVLSHVSADGDERAAKGASAYEGASARIHYRTRAEVGAMLSGFSVVDPGELVWSPHWHPDEQTPPLDSPGGATIWCAVARK